MISGRVEASRLGHPVYIEEAVKSHQELGIVTSEAWQCFRQHPQKTDQDRPDLVSVQWDAVQLYESSAQVSYLSGSGWSVDLQI